MRIVADHRVCCATACDTNQNKTWQTSQTVSFRIAYTLELCLRISSVVVPYYLFTVKRNQQFAV